MSVFRLLFLLFLCVGNALHAEPVALKNGLGQGMMFQFRGNCYVLFPSHVHQDGPVLNLFTGAPQKAGIATIYFRRPEPDFALGLVRGSATERCGVPFSELPKDVSRPLGSARRATLERVNPQGGVDKLAMRIDRTAWGTAGGKSTGGHYQYLFASIDEDAGETREVFQGTSGAFLYVDDVPVAMVVTAPDAKSVRALRIEELTGPLAVWLTSGSFGALQDAAAQLQEPAEGMAYKVTEWAGELVDETVPPTALASGQPFRVSPSSKGVSIVLELSEEAPVAVREISISGPQDRTKFATPRAIEIEVDRSRPGRGSFTTFASHEMVPGEDLTIPVNNFVRRVQINVNSSWAPGQPIEISGIRVIPSE